MESKQPHIRGRAGFCDIIRLYGYPGKFIVWATTCDLYDFHAKPLDGKFEFPVIEVSEKKGFPALSASIVEINGKPVPLLSAPITPPAADYPHVPQFDYNDGPQDLALSAVNQWRRS